MFASLNTLRYELMHQWNLDDFEFSETYLFFYDSDGEVEHIPGECARHARRDHRQPHLPGDQRRPGRRWRLVADVRRAGEQVRPGAEEAYPESANSKDSDAFKQYLNTKLREFAADLRDATPAGASVDELRAVKNDDMSTVYRICAISLGEPPEGSTSSPARDKNEARMTTRGSERRRRRPGDKGAKTGKDERRQIREHGITPMEFYKKYVPAGCG